MHSVGYIESKYKLLIKQSGFELVFRIMLSMSYRLIFFYFYFDISKPTGLIWSKFLESFNFKKAGIF